LVRKICAVTGTRAEYGLLKPILLAIEQHPELEFSLVPCGMHLSKEFGYTIKEIQKDFKIDATVDMLLSSDTGSAMAKSVGIGTIGFSHVYEAIKPDLVLVIGDRLEPFAAAIAAVYMNIPIAHVHGGEISAGVDEPVRHAITKLAHIHFASTEESAERIIKMGEEPWRVFISGAPGLDTILNKNLIKPEKILKRYGLDSKKPIILLIQHPVTTEVDESELQMRETLEGIVELEHQTVILYPNADAGGRKMIEILKKYIDKYPFIRAYKSIPHIEYLSLIKIASVMVGNSSSGIIETPPFHLPVVNIGTRQEGRQRVENILNVGYKKDEIIKAVKKALYDEDFKIRVKKCKNPYGSGKAGQRVVDILSNIKIDKKLIQKKMAY
jgi:UDP-N-acetylglucosamine 2-epimerase (non-hydrolysing)/GDP/UDP-N,N'-diacetylbacillosamine 2-epimerase (hydrolysing)